MLKPLTRALLIILFWLIALTLLLFADYLLLGMDRKIDQINEELMDLALSYDVLAFNLVANIPGCE